MQGLQIFNNEEFGQVRAFEIDGKPYFVAGDVAKALGYKDTINAIKQHCRWVVKHSIPHPQSKNKTLEVNGIPEGDVYRLITNSKLPTAEKFEGWVFDEVLPTLRKTGAYEIPEKPLSALGQLQLQSQAILEVHGEVHQVEIKVEAIAQDLQDFKQNLPLLPAEAELITHTVNKRAVAALGGKESNAYNDTSLRGKVYSDIHGELKRQFGVTKYKYIKSRQCDSAVSVIEEYELPLVLEDQILNCNAQMCM